MVEEVNSKNLYITVSSPNLNFNISRSSIDPLTVGSKVTGQERFYSVSMGVDVEVRIKHQCISYRFLSYDGISKGKFLKLFFDKFNETCKYIVCNYKKPYHEW